MSMEAVEPPDREDLWTLGGREDGVFETRASRRVGEDHHRLISVASAAGGVGGVAMETGACCHTGDCMEQ